MPVATRPEVIKSQPYSRRIGLIPLSLICVFGWVLALSWLAIGIWPLFNNLSGGSVLMTIMSLAFSCYMGFFTHRLIADSHRQFMVELSDHAVTLTGFDKVERKKTTRSIVLEDIEWAEHYPTRDVASILLRGTTAELDIPLWAFDLPQANKVLEFLQENDIRVITVGV